MDFCLADEHTHSAETSSVREATVNTNTAGTEPRRVPPGSFHLRARNMVNTAVNTLFLITKQACHLRRSVLSSFRTDLQVGVPTPLF